MFVSLKKMAFFPGFLLGMICSMCIVFLIGQEEPSAAYGELDELSYSVHDSSPGDEPIELSFEKSVTYDDVFEHHEFWPPSPSELASYPNGDQLVVYQLQPLMIAAKCEWSTGILTFRADRMVATFSCNELDNPLSFWSGDLPLVSGNGKTQYIFEFRSPLADDIYDAAVDCCSSRTMSGWSVRMSGEYPHIKLDELSIAKECEGRDLSFIFWANGEGLDTVCGENGLGLSEIEFPLRGAASIWLTR